MMSVSILINGKAIYTRTAVNVRRAKFPQRGCIYKLDTGQEIVHDPDEGGVALARKMLNTIVEVK